MTVLARLAIQEALRRRVFTVVAILTVAFLVLYGLGVWQAFDVTDDFSGLEGVDPEVVTGATMLGLAMFGTLFLGVVLAVFLTLGAVRGDAERGLLQPLLVRPASRRTLLMARMLSAGVVCAAYVIVVYAIAMVETAAIGGWWPDRPVTPALALAFAVVVVAALSVVGSVFLSSTANGIAVFMAFGAGLVAGLLGQIADVLNSDTLATVAEGISYALPFEALYQYGLSELTAGTVGFTRFALQLGPLGGANPAGVGLWIWAVVYLALLVAAGAAAFNRRDL